MQSINNDQDIYRRLVFLENQMKNLNVFLAQFFIKGRLRTDRTAPTSSSDVQAPDQLYDMVIDNSDIYVLIDNSGALSWRSVAISTF